MLSVILVQHNQQHLTAEAIRTFRNAYRGRMEILLVDNASDGTISSHEGVKLLRRPTNEGFGAANNYAARHAEGDILLFLNNDTVSDGDFVSPVLEEFRKDPRVGIIGPRIHHADGTLQLSCGPLPNLRVECTDKVLYRLVGRRWKPALRFSEWSRTRPHVEWVTGAALFIRAELFRLLDGFDEEYFMFFEDKDLCARARRQGFDVRFVNTPPLMHLGGGSSGHRRQEIEDIYRRSQITYYRKHRSSFERTLMEWYLKASGKAPRT